MCCYVTSSLVKVTNNPLHMTATVSDSAIVCAYPVRSIVFWYSLDTTDHNILLRLENLSAITGTALNWGYCTQALIPQNVTDYIKTLHGIDLASSITVRNLGFIFDQDVSITSKIKQICSTVSLHLCNIAKVWHILSQTDKEKNLMLPLGLTTVIPFDLAPPINLSRFSS